MQALLIIVLLALMGLVLYSLIRGIVAFLKTTKIDLENNTGENVQEMQMRQNNAMMARIKYQALAVVVVVILLAMGGKG